VAVTARLALACYQEKTLRAKTLQTNFALRQRERDGVVVLAPAPGLKHGDPVRITRGIFTGELALYDGMRPHERVGVLSRVLGRVELPAGDVVPATMNVRPARLPC
jgi:hypothetical protein